MTHEELLDRVVAREGVCGGEPCIRGTRIMISIVLDGLAGGMTSEEIISHYPRLTPDDIRGALAYASKLSKANHAKAAS